MFLRNDLYTASGSVKLWNCWTNNVTKFDTESFYNWEQDNQPIYDLEERTYLLWERLGHPTSSIPGLALVVSADAPASVRGCNKNIYTTVSAAIDALPEIINYPVLVEICNFGALGDLKLHNIKFGPRGSLEIVNRNFAKAEPIANATLLNVVTFDTDSPYPNEKYISQVSAATVLGFNFGPKRHLIDSSALSISTSVWSSTQDSRAIDANEVTDSIAMLPSHYGISKSTLTVKFITLAGGDPEEVLQQQAYEYDPSVGEDVGTYDVSTYNEITKANYTPYKNNANLTAAVGLYFSNKFNKVSVLNCDGPIYLRGLYADSSGYYGNVDYGFEISNSNNIMLEDCMSIRHKKAGFYFNNSKIIVSRGLVACRNYDFDSAGRRISGPWASKKYGNYNNTSSYLTEGEGAGVLAVNSDVYVSSTSAQYTAAMASDPTYSALAALFTPTQHLDYIFLFSRNNVGMKLVNSKLHGGYSLDPTATYPYRYSMNLVFECNDENALQSENSEIDWDGALVLHSNNKGIRLNNSVFKFEKLIAWLNQKYGIKATNSKLEYNKNLLPQSTDTVYQNYDFSGNSQHIVLDNSHLEPKIGSSIFNAINSFNLADSHGAQHAAFTLGSPYDAGLLPQVSIKNNSSAKLLHVLSERMAASMLDNQPLKGAAIEVLDNSKLSLVGSNRYATRIIGPNTYEAQNRKAALYAGNGSEINIAGPTVIAQYAIDALAEDGSRISFSPPKDNDGRLDISTYNLSSAANHTMVELHSTRACLVANKNSEISIKDLGDFTKTWARSTLGSSAIASGADYGIDSADMNYTPYVSAGSMQFYPNPVGAELYPPAIENVSFSNVNKNFSTGIYGDYYYLNSNIGVPSATASFSSITAGGVCVQAVNNSVINVQNVNFPCGWWNPSSVIYDLSGDNNLCDRLFIWEIKDNSHINASYCSVSGLFPESAGYIGPDGAWKTAAGVFLSGAPVGTPDTSSLSVLDYFGQCSANPYGKSSPQNFGPFRLYFSTDPAINCLASSSLDNYGLPAQVYAQGYQFSGNMIAAGNVSSQYPSLLMRNSNGVIVASGFYYGSSIINNPNYVRAILDESAGDTFANARHCTVGKSGMSKVVFIYLPYTDTYLGDSAINSVKNKGKGFRSTNSFDLERDN